MPSSLCRNLLPQPFKAVKGVWRPTQLSDSCLPFLHGGLKNRTCRSSQSPLLFNWLELLEVPDNSRLYHSRHIAEAKALNDKLILWPPTVIIHDSSIGIKVNTHEPMVVTNERIEERLRDGELIQVWYKYNQKYQKTKYHGVAPMQSPYASTEFLQSALQHWKQSSLQ